MIDVGAFVWRRGLFLSYPVMQDEFRWIQFIRERQMTFHDSAEVRNSQKELGERLEALQAGWFYPVDLHIQRGHN